MAETLVKNQVCRECGSEARPHALFCYHCGGALQIEDFPKDESKEEPSNVWFREEIVESTPEVKVQAETPEQETEEQIPQPKREAEVLEESLSEIRKPESKLFEDTDQEETREDEEIEQDSEKAEDTQIQIISKSFEKKAKTNADEDTKLRSASALRKRAKPTRLKKVEIVWEERDSSPNMWFIIFALVLSFLVTALIFIAFYLK